MPPKAASKKRKAGAPPSDGPHAAGHNEASPAPSGGSSTAVVHQPYPALKPPDGTALLRRDLQWDALELIFTSVTPRFTPPTYPDDEVSLFPTDRTWSFAELYLDCLANSSKANKNLKDKMSESTAFAVNFAKLCLLINAGRINTTLAFYPEMKTILRTYHPIPSMQLDDYSNKNLQDAPRMKAQLKGCHLPSDVDNQPDSLAELIRRATVLHWKPPACVVTCIFLLFNEWTRISAKYCPEGFVLADLFYPGDATNTIPSEQRAQSFLFLVHRFLETPDLVASDFANGEAKLPPDQLLDLTRKDCSDENQDTEDELDFARKMQAFREDFMEKYKAEELANVALSASAGGDESTPVPESESRKRKAEWLERTTSHSGKTARASSSTPSRPTSSAKKGRSEMSGAGTAETIADPPSGLAAHVAAENARIPTVKIEGQDHAGLSIIAPEATTAASVTSGAMTPTAIAPRLPALSLEDVGLTRTEYWRFAMKKRKAEAVNLVAKLVPLDEGLAEPEIAYQWSQYFQVAPKRARSQLQLAWQKVKRDMEEGRDPVYESEDEDDWTPQELEPRLSGFLFRNHRTESKDILRYQGNGPSFDTEQLSQYIHSMNPQHEGQAFSSTPSGDEVPLQYQQSPDSPSRTVAAKDSAKNATFQQSLTATAAEVASSDAVAKNDGGAMQLDTSTGELQQKASNAGLEEEVHARHRLTTEVGGTNNDDQI